MGRGRDPGESTTMLNRKPLLLWRLPACVIFCLSCSPSHVHAGQDEVDDSLKRGEELYQTHHLAPGRYEEAIRLYEEALTLRPEDYTILWKLSDMYENYGEMLDGDQKQQKIARWEKGAEYGRRAVEATPEGKEGHFFYMANMGANARIKGAWTSFWKFRRIKREMDRTLELDPDYPPALVARAQYLTEMPAVFGGDEQEAVRLYERALELDPGFIVALYYLARLDALHGRYDEALSKLASVLECKDPWNRGHMEKIVRPWCEELRREILQEEAEEP